MSERKNIIPLVERETPILSKIRGRLGRNEEKIIKNQDELVFTFREGIAEGLGLPLEAVEEAHVRVWIVEFIRTFVDPEYRTKTSPNAGDVRALGKFLGEMIQKTSSYKESSPSEEDLSSDQKSGPPRNRRGSSSVVKGE